jgi:hypothetical protein
MHFSQEKTAVISQTSISTSIFVKYLQYVYYEVETKLLNIIYVKPTLHGDNHLKHYRCSYRTVEQSEWAVCCSNYRTCLCSAVVCRLLSELH